MQRPTTRRIVARLAPRVLGLLSCLASANARATENEIGLYFDTAGTSTCYEGGLYQEIPCYIVLKNCTEPSGISGWEGRLSSDAGVNLIAGELYGQGTNFASFPELAVGLQQVLPAQPSMALMRFTIFAVSGGGLYLGPAANPSQPGATTPIMAAGSDPTVLFGTTYRVPPEVGPLARIGVADCEDSGEDGRPDRVDDVEFVDNPLVSDNCGGTTTPPAHVVGWDVPGDPWGIAVDSEAGYTFVTDPVGTRVCRYGNVGVLPSCWNCAAAEPRWLAIDRQNQLLYVTGQMGQKVQVFNYDGTLVREMGGPPWSTDPGSFASRPQALAVDTAGNLYVAEGLAYDSSFQGRLQVFSPSGVFQRVFATCFQYQMPPVAGQWFQTESMIVGPSGDLFLLDGGTGIPGQDYNRVHHFNAGGLPVGIWGQNGAGPGQLDYPFGIAHGGDGHLWITSGDRVIKFTLDGTFVLEFDDFHNDGFEGIAMASGPVEYLYVGTFGQGCVAERIEVFAAPIPAHNVLASHWQGPDHQLITSDLELLTDCSAANLLMNGVAADGVAPLLLRYEFQEPCTVDWWLTDPEHGVLGESNGCLATLDGSQQGQAVTTETQLVSGRHLAFVVYTAPVDFDRAAVPEDNERGERLVRVNLEFTATSGGESGDWWRDLSIIRPPVAFVHGIWSRPGTWDNFRSIRDDPRWEINGSPTWGRPDYSTSHGQAFAFNAGQLAFLLQTQKRGLREGHRIAAAQADVIAHSMGGCVARKLAATSAYERADNYGAGDYHKLLTLDTPHWGSAFADVVVQFRELTHAQYASLRVSAKIILGLLAHTQRTHFDQITGAAIDDLRPGSAELNSLPALEAPTHVHVGTGGSDLEASGLLEFNALRDASTAAYVVARELPVGDLGQFYTEPHDVIVLQASQAGGMTLGEVTTTAQFPGLHTQATRSDASGDLAVAWALRSIGDDSFFGPLPPPPVTQAGSGSLTVPEYGGVRVWLDPAAGSGRPGQEVSISVEPIGDAQIATAYLAFPGGVRVLHGPTFSGSVLMPEDRLGSLPVEGVALLADGTLVDAQPISINLDLSGVTLTAISVEPATLLLGAPGLLQRITVLGHYGDGFTRDMSAANGSMAFNYNHFVLAFDPDESVVQALAPGTTTMMISFQGHQCSLPVTVLDGQPSNSPPHARAGGRLSYCAGRELCLDGSDSFDYDTALGDQMSFAWDIDGDGAFDDAFGPTPCIELAEGTDDLLVCLQVTDQAGLWARDCAILSPEGGSCHDGTFVCEVGHDDPHYNQFDMAIDVAFDGQGLFRVLVMPIFSGPYRIVSFEVDCMAGCSFHSEFALPSSAHDVAYDAAGIAHCVHFGAVPSVRRFNLAGQELPAIVLPALPDPENQTYQPSIAIDGDGHILVGARVYRERDYGLVSYLVCTVDASGDLLRILDVHGDLGIEVTEGNPIVDFKVSGTGSIYLAGRHTVHRADWDGSYRLGLSFGSPELFPWLEDVAVGIDGSIYTAGNEPAQVQKFSAAGEFLAARTGSGGSLVGFNDMRALFVDGSDNVYVAEGYRRAQVFRFTPCFPVGVPEQAAPGRASADERRLLDLDVSGVATGSGGSITMVFSLSRGPVAVTLRVYDLRGRLVRTVLAEERAAGRHEVRWNGRSDSGTPLPSGVYLVQLRGGGASVTQKAVIVR